MKKKSAIVALLGILFFLLEGCIPSLHPIYTEDKLVTLKELPGTWVNYEQAAKLEVREEDKLVSIRNEETGFLETWFFERNEGKSYQLIHRDSEKNAAAFEVHIIKLGGDYFMDFYPTDLPAHVKETLPGLDILNNPEKMNSFRAIHLYPVHTFAKLEISSKELKISMFDPDFLEKLLERRQIRIKHEKTMDGYVLTASPEELQKFVEKYAHVDEAFMEDPIVLKNKL